MRQNMLMLSGMGPIHFAQPGTRGDETRCMRMTGRAFARGPPASYAAWIFTQPGYPIKGTNRSQVLESINLNPRGFLKSQVIIHVIITR